jgi:hypothetical protein
VSSRELTEWQEYAKLEPFGEERDDIRIALLCQTMANMWAKKSDGSAFTISDFLLDFLTPERIAAILADDEDLPAPSIAVDDFDSPFDDSDVRAAKEKAVRMAKLIVEMNKALGGRDQRPPEKRAALAQMAGEDS